MGCYVGFNFNVYNKLEIKSLYHTALQTIIFIRSFSSTVIVTFLQSFPSVVIVQKYWTYYFIYIFQLGISSIHCLIDLRSILLVKTSHVQDRFL